MFRNLIFDWSGTLADDLALVLDATNTVFRHYGLEEMDHGEFKTRFRLPYPDFYAEVLPEVNLGELEDVFRSGFKVSDKTVTILPHAREFMEYCRDRGIRCFALTSVDKNAFEKQVTDLNLKEFFEAIYSGVLNKCEVIHNLLETHGLNPEETAFIGDMTHDVETAAQAGITSIAVLTGYQSAGQLSQATPDIITPDLRVLKRLLDKKAYREAARHHLCERDDCLRINGLSLKCHIGVPDEERAAAQTLKAHVILYPATRLTGLADEFANTVDYAAVADTLIKEAAAKPRKLIETLAEDLALILLSNYPLVAVRIRLDKFILPDADSVSVEICLHRDR